MPHEYKVGDKVRIKKRKGIATDYPFCFCSAMADLEGRIFTIRSIVPCSYNKNEKIFTRKYSNGDYNYYILEGDSSNWHSSMFEPVDSLHERDEITLAEFTGTVVGVEGTFHVNFMPLEDHEKICKKLRKRIFEFDLLAMKFGARRYTNGEFFPEFNTLSELSNFYNKLKSILEPSTNSNQPEIKLKNNENNEIKFQRPKASLVRGSVPKGHRICSRRNKTAISIGHLSNRACHF